MEMKTKLYDKDKEPWKNDKKFKAWLLRSFFVNLDLIGHANNDFRLLHVNLEKTYDNYKKNKYILVELNKD